MSLTYHLGKANVVANIPIKVSMFNVSHIKDGKRELVKDVYHLAHLRVRLSGSSEGGILVHNRSESSLVVNAIVNQDLDLTFVELKMLVVDKKIELFSYGEMVFSITKGGYVFPI